MTAVDEYRIDSHKLMYHVERVYRWLQGELIYPIYMEASPSGACNHRCTFCGLDFMGYRPRFLDAEVFERRLGEMAGLGLKSIMYGGEGEPLLHKEMARLIEYGKKVGLDNALTTNGVLLDMTQAERILPCTEWIKVSINAGTPETYADIHRTKAGDFDTVIKNVAAASDIKKKHGYKCALGMQMILLPENRHEARLLAIKARDAGADYLTIKPYSQHPLSRTTVHRDVRYENEMSLSEDLSDLRSPTFSIVVRANAMRKWDEGKLPFRRCLALPFWSYVDSTGNVWGCSCFLGDDRFLYGNLLDNTFEEIWAGEKRRVSSRWVEEELDASNCRVNCRMNEINKYLCELNNPPGHVNFI